MQGRLGDADVLTNDPAFRDAAEPAGVAFVKAQAVALANGLGSRTSAVRWRDTAVNPRWTKSALAGPLGADRESVNTISSSLAAGCSRSRSAATIVVTPGARPAFITTVPRAPPAIARSERAAAAGGLRR